jgi:hypothetical protein
MTVLSVKDLHCRRQKTMSVVRFQNLPLADKKRRWSGTAANKRVRKWANAEESPTDRYKKAFVWYDADEKDKFRAYKFQIADVVDGRMKAVPRAIMNAAAVVQGARGGTRLPKRDIERVKAHLARYYEKMREIPPWEEE